MDLAKEIRETPLRVLVLSRHSSNETVDHLGSSVANFLSTKVIVPSRYVNASSTSNLWWLGYRLAVARQAARFQRTAAFDLIHAYGIYPDGCVAARLGSRYKIPFVITESTDWVTRLEDHPRLLRHAVAASRESAFHLAASRAIRESIAAYAGESEKLRVLPQDLTDLYAEAVQRHSWRMKLSSL
jgi:hypothetical protein